MSQEDSAPSRMSLYDHVDELRVRFMRCLIAFLLGFLALYFVSDSIMAFLRAPLFHAMPPDQQKLYFTTLFENFLTHLKIAGYASLFALSPYYFYQLWAFIAPGLYPKERRMVLPFIGGATFFFLAGAAFAYYVLFPVGFKFFVTYGSPSDVPLLTIAGYYDTCLKLMLLFGGAFELPVLIVLLGYLGVVDAKFLRSQRRTAILIITVISALFAPPDAMSMIMLAVPLYFMFEGSIWVVQWLGVRKKQIQDEGESHSLVGKSRP